MFKIVEYYFLEFILPRTFLFQGFVWISNTICRNENLDYQHRVRILRDKIVAGILLKQWPNCLFLWQKHPVRLSIALHLLRHSFQAIFPFCSTLKILQPIYRLYYATFQQLSEKALIENEIGSVLEWSISINRMINSMKYANFTLKCRNPKYPSHRLQTTSLVRQPMMTLKYWNTSVTILPTISDKYCIFHVLTSRWSIKSNMLFPHLKW